MQKNNYFEIDNEVVPADSAPVSFRERSLKKL